MEFVTFEIAKKLKEKGFKMPCIAHYYCLVGNVLNYNITTDCIRGSNFKCLNDEYNLYIDAPTISQVLEWFRKEHHLHFEVVGAAYGYNLIISDTPDKGGTDRYYSNANDDGPNYAGAWNDHDDCVLYGIAYTLDNLI